MVILVLRVVFVKCVIMTEYLKASSIQVRGQLSPIVMGVKLLILGCSMKQQMLGVANSFTCS